MLQKIISNPTVTILSYLFSTSKSKKPVILPSLEEVNIISKSHKNSWWLWSFYSNSKYSKRSCDDTSLFYFWTSMQRRVLQLARVFKNIWSVWTLKLRPVL